MMELLCLNESRVFIYEQLNSVKEVVSKLDCEVVVLRNNLFTDQEGYPSAVDPLQLERLSRSEEGGDEACGAGGIYARVDYVDGAMDYVVSPVRVDRGLDVLVEDIFECPSIEVAAGVARYAEVSIPGPSSLELRLDAMNGVLAPCSFVLSAPVRGLRRSKTKPIPPETLRVFRGLFVECDVPVEVIARSEEVEPATDYLPELRDLLKRHWGEEAEFRDLLVYSDPDESDELEEISQGRISSFVVNQVQSALDGRSDFENVLLTAPTGAGKSILFQLPAMYLAETRGVLTLVVSPLKALMHDQVRSLRKRGVSYVVELNSDQTYDERQQEIERIKTGSASIVYLSPELLLANGIDSLIGPDREIGLVVVDEAHTVTSWGKDFRPDYWYLGSHLRKLQNRNKFPLFCLTATAVYGGGDDTVRQTIQDLRLGDVALFLGSPRRNNISFKIRHRNKKDFSGPIDTVKNDLAYEQIKHYLKNGNHGLVYCPYASQVSTIIDRMKDLPMGSVLPYRGDLDSEVKRMNEKAFREGQCKVLVATKAFGMGVDISDIDAVYHFAPPGTLADYVQEIGRAARKSGLQAVASMDFFDEDLRFANTLYALSSFAQWQLKSMMQKLHSIYKNSGGKERTRSQNLHVSPESFTYLFPDDDDSRRVARVKSALMMISQDMEDRTGYPMLIVKPQPLNTVIYVCVPPDLEKEVEEKYKAYFKVLTKCDSRVEKVPGQHDVRVAEIGSIYRLNAVKLWEDCFPSYTYADFLRRLLKEGSILTSPSGSKLSNRAHLSVRYYAGSQETHRQLDGYVKALLETFRLLSRNGQFTQHDFDKVLSEQLEWRLPQSVRTDQLLKLFLRSGKGRGKLDDNKFHFVQSRRVGQYAVLSFFNPLDFRKEMTRAAKSLEGGSDNRYSRYVDVVAAVRLRRMAEFLQVLGLAEYQIEGGDTPELFVRLNDPERLLQLACDPKYNNHILEDLRKRHSHSIELLKKFFSTPMEDKLRWDLIEEYFLGNDEYVAQVLGIGGAEQTVKPKLVGGKDGGSRGAVPIDILDDGEDLTKEPYFRLWKRLLQLDLSNDERRDVMTLRGLIKSSLAEQPLEGTVLGDRGGETVIKTLVVWPKSKVALLRANQVAEYGVLRQSGWKPFALGGTELISGLAAAIGAVDDD